MSARPRTVPSPPARPFRRRPPTVLASGLSTRLARHPGRHGKDTRPVGGDGHGVLEVGREASVGSYGGPAVFEDIGLAPPCVYHGLYGEDHPGFKPHASSRFSKVRHLGGLVELSSYAVAHEVSDHGKALGLHETLDGGRDVEEAVTHPRGLYRPFEGLPCHVYEAPGLLAYPAYGHRDGRIPVVAL